MNRYIEQHKDHIAIWKLRNNVKLELGDYQALENIFTKELGDEEDYKREFGDTPFSLLIRNIAKLENEAAIKHSLSLSIMNHLISSRLSL